MKLKLQTPISFNVQVIGPKARRRVPVILDTGARFTVLSWDILKEIGYDPARAKEKVSIITANGVIEAPFLKVKGIILGDVEINNVETVAQDIPELIDVEGLLGLSFLEKTIININYKTKTLKISKAF